MAKNRRFSWKTSYT